MVSFSHHIRFMETRDGWPHFTDEEIRAAYNKSCAQSAFRAEVQRKRWAGCFENTASTRTTRGNAITVKVEHIHSYRKEILPMLMPPNPGKPAERGVKYQKKIEL